VAEGDRGAGRKESGEGEGKGYSKSQLERSGDEVPFHFVEFQLAKFQS